MEKRKKSPVIWLTILLLAGVVLLLWRTGFFEVVGSVEGMRSYMTRFSPYSHVAFFLLQLFSVLLAPIPSNLSALAGALLFGMWPAFLLTMGAVFLGSFLVFQLARSLGRPFVERLVSERVSLRYLKIIQTKRDAFLVLAFLLPFFPDDLLCILAGLSDIPRGRFLAIVVLARPWGLLAASALGGGTLDIPPCGMAAIAVAAVLFFLVGMKYGDKLEETVLEYFKRKRD